MKFCCIIFDRLQWIPSPSYCCNHKSFSHHFVFSRNKSHFEEDHKCSTAKAMAFSFCSFLLILPLQGSEEKGSPLQLQTAQLQVSSTHFLTGRGHQKTNLPKPFPLQEHSQESPIGTRFRMNLQVRRSITPRQLTEQPQCLLQVFKTLIWLGQVGNFTI